MVRRRTVAIGAAAVAAVLVITAMTSRDVARVTIPAGSSVKQIAESLHSSGVISSPSLFRVYVRFTGRERGLRAGTFLIPKDLSWGGVLDSLTRSMGVSEFVTVPEGYSLAAIESLLVRRLQLHPESVSRAMRDSALLARFNITASTTEGYLFPDSYHLPVGISAVQAVRVMLDRFIEMWDPRWDPRLAELGMSRHQLLTLASIVEKEAVVAEERAVIAAVFHNRLRIGMPLQADPTVQYAKGEHSERVYLKDLEIDSPYNTYRYAGLPPGPIASPGVASIAAALYPADVSYLYFVAHPDGHHEFRQTFAEHLVAKQMVERMRDRSGR